MNSQTNIFQKTGGYNKIELSHFRRNFPCFLTKYTISPLIVQTIQKPKIFMWKSLVLRLSEKITEKIKMM